MSRIQTIDQFVSEYGRQHMNLCKELNDLAEQGMIIIEAENIDEKGYGWCFSIRFRNSVRMMRFCPFCGEKVMNAMTSTSLKGHGNTVCLNPDLPENRLNESFSVDDEQGYPDSKSIIPDNIGP